VIIRDFDLECITASPYNTDSVLVVDPDTVLSEPVASQLFQSVTRWAFRVVQRYGIVQHRQLSLGNAAGGEPRVLPVFQISAVCSLANVLITVQSITVSVIIVNRYYRVIVG
jgi:hypothetical protein